jgi:DNA-3-methyladenine glycosylase II
VANRLGQPPPALHQEAIQYLSVADPKLAAVIRRVGPCLLKPRITARSAPLRPYEALVRAIAYQQLNGRAAETIFSRVLALYPDLRFPEPAQLLSTADESLRGAGLSRSKTASVKDIAAKTLDGVVPPSRELAELDDEEILKRLTVIRGVGPWTVHMLLIFHLGRPDVLPATDYGVLQGFKKLYGKRAFPKPAHLARYAERWRPHRSVASWYLWRVLELE